MRGSTWDAIHDAIHRSDQIRKHNDAAEIMQGFEKEHVGFGYATKQEIRRLLRNLNRITHREKVKDTKKHHKGGKKHLTYYGRRK